MLPDLFKNPEVTEIFIQTGLDLHYEEKGELKTYKNFWSNTLEKEDFFNEVLNALPKAPNYENPLASGIWRDFRVQTAFPPATKSEPLLQLRKKSSSSLYTKSLESQWGVSLELKNLLIQKIKREKRNFIIIGPTGCGKTSFLKSLLFHFCQKDRVICLEDTPELPLINDFSSNLQTFSSPSNEVQDIDLKDLLKASLRLRPDRLMMGEMRGEEAADFLLMLSTGHQGSGATLHAENTQDALRRLEMLVQMGASWSLDTIRRLIHSSLHLILTMEKTEAGRRQIRSISEIRGLEDTGFLVHTLYQDPPLESIDYAF